MLNSAQKLLVIRFFVNIHDWTLNTEPLEDRSEETSASVASISCSSLVSASALRLLLMLFRISRCFFCNSCDSLHDSLVTAYLVLAEGAAVARHPAPAASLRRQSAAVPASLQRLGLNKA